MKKILITLCVCIVISAIAWSDYYWGSHKIEGSNLTLVSTRNDWSIIKPWTWVKQPVIEILWVDEFAPINEQYFLVFTVYERKGQGGHRNMELVDVVNKRFTGITESELKSISPDKYSNLSWLDADGCMKDLIPFLLRKNSGLVMKLNP